MTAALAPVDNGEAMPGLVRENAYVLPPTITFERWQQVGANLQQMQRSVNWWAGDWLRFGEERWGEAAYQAVAEITGHGDESLKQAVWVASKFPESTRVLELSWAHHRAVSGLEPEDRSALLQEAVTARLSTRDLVQRVKDVQEQARAIPADSTPVCAAEGAWRPTPADLTEEAAARKRFERTMAGRGAGFDEGWTAALAWVEALDCFVRD